MHQQIPILCKNCTGPAKPAPDGTLHCPYCGCDDKLPTEEIERVRELKRRVKAAAKAVAQLRRAEARLAAIYEDPVAFLKAGGLPLFVGQLVIIYCVIDAIRSGTFEHTVLLNVVPILTFTTAPLFALLVGRRAYRRTVRPLLWARAPRGEGLPARCRACDAPLPDRRKAFVVCEYCSTHNLITRELQQDRERLLAGEEQFYRDRAGQAEAKAKRISRRMSGIDSLWASAAFLAMLVGGLVAMFFKASCQ